MIITNLSLYSLIYSQSFTTSPQFTRGNNINIYQSVFRRYFSTFVYSSKLNLMISSSLFSSFLRSPIKINKYHNNVNVHSEIYSNVNIQSTCFTRCNAISEYLNEGAGGAIFGYKAQLHIKDCIFDDNCAIYGGAVTIYNGTLNVESSLFKNCKALNDVGAIWFMGCERGYSFNITMCNFSSNSANTYGAICSNFTNPIMSNSWFIKNRGNFEVGALGIIECANLSLSFSCFFENSCKNEEFNIEAPAIWLQNTNYIEFGFLSFVSNTVDNNNEPRGIGLYSTYNTKVNIVYKDYVCFDGELNNFISKTNNFEDLIEINKNENFFGNIHNYDECKLNWVTSESENTITSNYTSYQSSIENSEFTSYQSSIEDSEFTSYQSSIENSEFTSYQSSVENSEFTSYQSNQQSESETSDESIPNSNFNPLFLLFLLLLLLLIFIVFCCCKKNICSFCKCLKCLKCCCKKKKQKKDQENVVINNIVVYDDDVFDIDDYLIFSNPNYNDNI